MHKVSVKATQGQRDKTGGYKQWDNLRRRRPVPPERQDNEGERKRLNLPPSA